MGGGCGNSRRVLEGTFMNVVSKVEEVIERECKHSTLALVWDP